MKHAPRRRHQDFFDQLIAMLNAPLSLGPIFDLQRRLIFRGGETSIENVTAPIPTGRYMRRLRYAAQHPTRRPA